MSKSYRKPYSTITGHTSAAEDKRIARRMVRHQQNQDIRDLISGDEDLDSFLISHRYECSFNDVWSWGRDGKLTLRKIDHNDLNPFYCHRKEFDWSLEKILEYHFESLERQLAWIEELKRK
jgi:hypothetical protein